MKVELNVLQRLHLLSTLPTKGDILTLRTLQDTYDLFGFSDEEKEKYGIIQEGPQVRWDGSGDAKLPFEVSSSILQVVRRSLQRLEQTHELELGMLDLYEMFVENKPTE